MARGHYVELLSTGLGEADDLGLSYEHIVLLLLLGVGYLLSNILTLGEGVLAPLQ